MAVILISQQLVYLIENDDVQALLIPQACEVPAKIGHVRKQIKDRKRDERTL